MEPYHAPPIFRSPCTAADGISRALPTTAVQGRQNKLRRLGREKRWGGLCRAQQGCGAPVVDILLLVVRQHLVCVGDGFELILRPSLLVHIRVELARLHAHSGIIQVRLRCRRQMVVHGPKAATPCLLQHTLAIDIGPQLTSRRRSVTALQSVLALQRQCRLPAETASMQAWRQWMQPAPSGGMQTLWSSCPRPYLPPAPNSSLRPRASPRCLACAAAVPGQMWIHRYSARRTASRFWD